MKVAITNFDNRLKYLKDGRNSAMYPDRIEFIYERIELIEEYLRLIIEKVNSK